MKRGVKRKLTDEQAKAIIYSRKSLDKIAEEFGVSKTLVIHIRRGTSKVYAEASRV